MPFDIVVSAENSHYMAWQTKLFCYSAMIELRQSPTVVVHESEANTLHPAFEEVRNWGCRVIRAPCQRSHPIGDFPPRNEPGSLAIASELSFSAEQILFCEADMLFCGELSYSCEIAAEHYTYLNYADSRIKRAAQELGLDFDPELLNRDYAIGVPYLLPTRLLKKLANRWMQVLDAFQELTWIDIMYAFGIALLAEGIKPTISDAMVDNLDSLCRLRRPLIHYCYGDRIWRKRDFVERGDPIQMATRRLAHQFRGTVAGEIAKQMICARTFSRCPRALQRTFANASRFAARHRHQEPMFLVP